MIDNPKVKVKDSILKIKQTLINEILDLAGANDEDIDVQLLTVINNIDEEVLVAFALEFALFNDDYIIQLTNELKQSISDENMPF